MLEETAVNLFDVRGRFLRSVHLERDWFDPTALQDYILTQHTRQSLQRLTDGLAPFSGLRAWRITGDYGAGKSAFALLVAHLLSERYNELPFRLQKAFDWSTPVSTTSGHPYLIPVLVTGTREPLGLAITRALCNTLKNLSEVPTELLKELENAVNKETFKDHQILGWIQESHSYIVKKGIANGLLLIIDEAGKFLEYAAFYPDRQDIYLLQALAEAASRSGASPLIILVLLHQGVSAYSENLSQVQQREWEKIAGRFEELVWQYPIEQVAELVANALNTNLDVVSPQQIELARQGMLESLTIRWYRASVEDTTLPALAPHFYPLHPTVLPPLVRFFSQFGQNERSLFTFLLGGEAFALQDFVQQTNGTDFLRLYDLFDYIRSAFAPRLQQQSYRSHWKAIDGIVTSYRGNDLLELRLLKSIGLLNVLNADDLLATSELLQTALTGCGDVKAALQRLKNKRVIYLRGVAGGYSVWPHTSVNLEKALEDATRNIEPTGKVVSYVREQLDIRQLVARRHYIETGNLRYFEVVYTEASELENLLINPFEADGRILIVLCETPTDEKTALSIVNALEQGQYTSSLIAVSAALQGFKGIIDELRCWEWVARHIPELQYDTYAQEEVTRQQAAAQQVLEERLEMAVGVLNSTGESNLRWFRSSQELPNLRKGRAVTAMLSTICDEQYPKAPRILNELINRQSISSTAAKARMRVIEQLFIASDQPFIGLDSTKTPPEMSMYLSVLLAVGLHQKTETGWAVRLPEIKNDVANVLPSFERIRSLLQEQPDSKIPVTQIYKALKAAPYGVREGMVPMFLTIFAVLHETELAFYEDGSFIPRLIGSNFLRLTKAPETFEIQYYPITGVRSELFKQVIQHLQLGIMPSTNVDILDVVKPLLTFVASLPAYSQKTSRLSPNTLAVRTALQSARDPAALLFQLLPQACGFSPITSLEDAQQQSQLLPFADALKESIDELRSAYHGLLQELFTKLQEEAQLKDSFDQFRQKLAPRAASVANFVTEPRLKSFCLRLSDVNLPETQWLEALGTLVCSLPPNKWKNSELFRYNQDVHYLYGQFVRVEALVYTRDKTIQKGTSVRVALTQEDGQEREQVLHLAPEELQQAASIEQKILTLINQNKRVGLAAASQALWKMLADNSENNEQSETP